MAENPRGVKHWSVMESYVHYILTKKNSYMTVRTCELSHPKMFIPHKEITVHYHCQVQCVKAAKPAFIPSSLHIPTDIYSHLIGNLRH